MEFDLTPVEKQYLATYMNKVSRSFALVTPCVEPPLDEYLAVAYLICRVVDNVEDCTQPLAWQRVRFAELAQMLKEPGLAEVTLAAWEKENWPGLTVDEKLMMSANGGLMLWQIFAQMPVNAQDSIARWATEMAEGMEKTKDPEQDPLFYTRQGVYLPAREADYNAYCYFVAGTVGHMATELVIAQYGLNGEVNGRLLRNSEACGRALQKTNIVKDFAKDLGRGISYLPDEWMEEVDFDPLSLAGAPLAWKKKVVGNVLVELADSVAYVLDLPHTAVGYRQASLLTMLPAYRTMLLAAQRHETMFTADHQIKISRDTMSQCLLDAQLMVTDDGAIQQYSQKITSEIDVIFNE